MYFCTSTAVLRLNNTNIRFLHFLKNGLQKRFYCNTKQLHLKHNTSLCCIRTQKLEGLTLLRPNPALPCVSLQRSFSDDKDKQPQLSSAQKLKKAVAEYGTTVVVFHIAMSLVSLGCCYILVSSGIDLNNLASSLGFGEKVTQMGANAGTFVVAYAIHKSLMPIRIGITVTAVPLIVRYLRSKGILKPPQTK